MTDAVATALIRAKGLSGEIIGDIHLAHYGSMPADQTLAALRRARRAAQDLADACVAAEVAEITRQTNGAAT